MTETRAGVTFTRRGAAVVATLDRPAKLNAINSAMKMALTREIPRIARDPNIYAVCLRAAPARMFSAGGDVREIHALAESHPAAALEACRLEYGLVWLMDCFSKPTLAMIEGAILGTGAGLAATMTHRAAGEGYRFQMPETAIGYFPDNGVSWHLARMPHEIGTWLGLTGTAIDRADAYWLGLVTHCIGQEHFEGIVEALADAQPIDPLLGARHVDPGPPKLRVLSETIERCFSADSVAEILSRLEGERADRDWCKVTAAQLAQLSPTALEVTLRLIRRARHLDLRQTLILEHRLARHLIFANDFREGVRVRVIEKAGAPQWRPASVSDIDGRDIERLLVPFTEGELRLPTRQEMQAARV